LMHNTTLSDMKHITIAVAHPRITILPTSSAVCFARRPYSCTIDRAFGPSPSLRMFEFWAANGAWALMLKSSMIAVCHTRYLRIDMATAALLSNTAAGRANIFATENQFAREDRAQDEKQEGRHAAHGMSSAKHGSDGALTNDAREPLHPTPT